MSETLEKEGLSEMLDATKAMSEGDFNKSVNTKLQGELGELARYIDKTRRSLQKLDPVVTETTDKMPQASSQLTDITMATEAATHKIMTFTEKVMDDQEIVSVKIKDLREAATASTVDSTAILRIARDIEEINNKNKNDMIEILTALSFQDLTGQKIKKIIALVGDVETRILGLLISFGIKKEDGARKEAMMGQLKDASKGLGVNQVLVDDILKNLGM